MKERCQRIIVDDMRKQKWLRLVLRVEDLERKYREESEAMWRLEAELPRNGVLIAGVNAPKGLFAVDIGDPPGLSTDEVIRIFKTFGCEAHPIDREGD
jgi:hypothetical protein